MIKVNVSTGESNRPVEMSAAILLYQRDKQYSSETEICYATVHKVGAVNGRMEIGPGRPVTECDVKALAEGLENQDAMRRVRWVDSSVLAMGPDRLIWWTPPTVKAMFYQRSNTKASFSGSGSCPVPGMVWMVIKGELFVFAVEGDGRPEPDTKLYQAPFFNVWGSGKVCTGNSTVPTIEQAGNTKAWEQMFFGSYFTHPNIKEKNKLIKGSSPMRFWKEMVNNPTDTFPKCRLVSTPMVCNDLLTLSTR